MSRQWTHRRWGRICSPWNPCKERWPGFLLLLEEGRKNHPRLGDMLAENRRKDCLGKRCYLWLDRKIGKQVRPGLIQDCTLGKYKTQKKLIFIWLTLYWPMKADERLNICRSGITDISWKHKMLVVQVAEKWTTCCRISLVTASSSVLTLSGKNPNPGTGVSSPSQPQRSSGCWSCIFFVWHSAVYGRTSHLTEQIFAEFKQGSPALLTSHVIQHRYWRFYNVEYILWVFYTQINQ